MQTFEEQNTLD